MTEWNGPDKMKMDIIRNTVKLFHVYGVKSLLVSDIAQLSGMSVRALNSYFTNKESLLKSCVEYKISQEEIFKYADDGLLDVLVNYAETYPKFLQRINRRCCTDIKKYYPSVYVFLCDYLERYTTVCRNKVETEIMNGYIRKNTSPVLVYDFLNECFSHLFEARIVFRENERLMLTERILVFTRGIVTVKGKVYMEKKLKIKNIK